jgi:hypothetical protein
VVKQNQISLLPNSLVMKHLKDMSLKKKGPGSISKVFRLHFSGFPFPNQARVLLVAKALLPESKVSH